MDSEYLNHIPIVIEELIRKRMEHAKYQKVSLKSLYDMIMKKSILSVLLIP